MEDFRQLTHMLVRDNKFGEIYNLNLIEACHSEIFALVLSVIYWKKIVKNKDYKNY